MLTAGLLPNRQSKLPLLNLPLNYSVIRHCMYMVQKNKVFLKILLISIITLNLRSTFKNENNNPFTGNGTNVSMHGYHFFPQNILNDIFQQQSRFFQKFNTNLLD